jgi:hypothetical protein
MWFVITLLYKRAEPARAERTKSRQKKVDFFCLKLPDWVLLKTGVSLLPCFRASLIPLPTPYCEGRCWLDWNFEVTCMGVKTACSAADIRQGGFSSTSVWFLPPPPRPPSFNCTNELARVLYCVHGEKMVWEGTSFADCRERRGVAGSISYQWVCTARLNGFV